MAKPARSAPELEALILQAVEQQLGVNAIDGCRVYALAARDNSGANWGVGPAVPSAWHTGLTFSRLGSNWTPLKTSPFSG